MKQRPRIYYTDSQKALIGSDGSRENRFKRLPTVWTQPLFNHTDPGRNRWNTSNTTMPVEVGADVS